MKASELITLLQDAIDKYGDLETYIEELDGEHSYLLEGVKPFESGNDFEPDMIAIY